MQMKSPSAHATQCVNENVSCQWRLGFDPKMSGQCYVNWTIGIMKDSLLDWPLLEIPHQKET